MMLRAKKKKQSSSSGVMQTDEVLKTKEKELVSSQSRIAKLKGEIGLMRRQLEGVFNIDHIVKLEDELKDKTRILSALESEHQSLLNVSREQAKAYKILSKEDDYQKSIEKLSDELREAKEKLKKLQAKQKEEEKALKEQHNKVIGLEERNRRLYQMTEEKKKQKEGKMAQTLEYQAPREVTDQEIKDLEERIKYAEEDKQAREKEFKKQIAKQEQSIQQLKYEIKKNELEKKEKDQESRLNELKIRELRRQIPQMKMGGRSMSRGSLGNEKLLLKKEDIDFRGGANSSTPKARLMHKKNIPKPSVFFKNNCTPSTEELMNEPQMGAGEMKERNGVINTVEEEQTQIQTEFVESRDYEAENENSTEKEERSEEGERVEIEEKRDSRVIFDKGFR